ncbi:integral membrane protein [Lachnospiraceae bacterium KM106-2]|nr:integral membrane protein [Lachnospiraceae bacterium KM106-2]
MEMSQILYITILTFIACLGLSIHFNLKGYLMAVAAFGGALTLFVFEIAQPMHSIVAQSFVASIVSSIYAESLARKLKVPATTFLIIAIIPLVPGSNIYHTMELCINRQIMPFITAALQTLGIAGAIALGILFVSSIFRFITVIKNVSARKRIKTTSR